MSSQSTSIGSCPSHWDVVKFSTVAELKHGYQFRTTDFTDEGVKVLKITQIKDNGSVDISSCSYIDEKRLKSFENNIVKKGDILMALSGATIGKIGRYKSDEIVLQNYRVGNFIPLNEQVLNKDYFYHFLTTENTYYQILANQNQSAQENIGKEDIHNMLVFLPPLPEQTAIATVLSSLDDKIDLLHRQNATLEKMAETLFRQWFVEEAKEEWEEGTLDDILTVKGGTTPSTSESDYWNGSIHWTSPRDITNLNGIYLFDTERKITELGLSKISSGLLPKGTLLMSSRAPVGVLAFCEVPVAINQGYIAIIDDKGYSKEFIYLWLKTNIELVHSFSNGSTFMEISKSAFKTLQLQIPPPLILNEFQTLIKPLFEKIKSNQTQIRTLTALRDTLLPKLMSGEVRVV